MFKEGDYVQWMKAYSRGRSVTVSQKYGKIMSIEGDCAVVKNSSSKRNERIKLKKLLPQGGRGHVDKVFEALCRAQCPDCGSIHPRDWEFLDK